MGVDRFEAPLVSVCDEMQKREESVVSAAKNGDLNAVETLMNRYKRFVRAKAKSYYIIGADREDIVQEGMIGLFKAIRDYRNDRPSSFKSFAELCITRQMITAIKSATRQKHIPLNSSISLNKPMYDQESERTLLDVVTNTRLTNPEDLMICREELGSIENQMGDMLSDLELKVLTLYINGRSYQEIAADMGRHVKSIDNALQRVKKKLEKYMEAKSLAFTRQER